MKRVKTNINYKIWVKLTPEADKIYHDHWHQYDEILGRAGYEPPKLVKVNGWTEFQMWDFMHIFGWDFHIGMGGPIETSVQIEVEDEQG